MTPFVRFLFSASITGLVVSTALAAPLVPAPDSLLAAARQAPSDTARARTLLRLSAWYQSTDSARTRQYAQQALHLARQVASRPLEAAAWLRLGEGYQAHKRPQLALDLCQRALVLFAKLGDADQQGRCLYTLGRAQLSLGQYAQARAVFRQELALWQQAGNPRRTAEAYARLGESYGYNDATASEGLPYLLKSLKMAEEGKFPTVMLSVLRSLVSVYERQDDFKRALGYLRRELQVARDLNDPEKIGGAHIALGLLYQQDEQDSLSAMHLQAGLNLLQPRTAPQLDYEKGVAYYTLGELTAKKPGAAAAAIGHYRHAAALFRQKEGLGQQYVSTMTVLALFQLGQGQTVAARKTLAEAARTAPAVFYSVEGSYDVLAKVSAANREYADAYRYQQRYQGLHDSLFNEAKSQQLAEVTTRYETQEKEEKISALQRATALQHRTRTWLLAALAAVLLLSAATYWRYRRERRARREVQAKEVELAARNQQLLHTEEQLRRSLDDKEVLLKEVHHRVKNNLQVITSRLALQGQEPRANPLVRAALRDIENWVQSISLMHHMLYQSADLASVAFQPFLEQLVTQMHRTFAGGGAGTVTCAVHAPAVRLGSSTAVPLGLIINELLSNTYKHAFANGRAGHVDISLAPEPAGGYSLRVYDNGAGLPAGFSLAATASLGLRLVHSLVRKLKGTLAVKQPGVGTEFTLMFQEIE
ncbi:histidine kinase dimerization/phosphoacceptor domain -containing protein [Hymenobacter antarcticus]|uniref:histidine kinase n=1 Tax=Hymenobacter antarcticus TaxID=486270 RepID=A0ABP7Q5N8_9BACT